MLTAASRVESTPRVCRSGVHSGLSISAVRRALSVFRKSAFLRLAAPDALPPARPRSLASLLVRTGFKFSLLATHLTFQSICFWV
nr:MAG TPA: hypothetical protein [Caudoviricetes sp.]